ncbi:hypothetical protein ABIE24_001773 [Mycetocola sp. 2940]
MNLLPEPVDDLTTIDAPELDEAQIIKTNAWTGDHVAESPFGPGYPGWAGTQPKWPTGGKMFPPPPASPADWEDARVGWGLVLPDRAGWSPEQLARAEDARPSVRELLASRPGSKVLRYIHDEKFSKWVLRDYANGGDRPIDTSPPGTGPDGIPAYLLIIGSPQEIPWDVQFQLGLVRRVGRLDLTDDGLDNYVHALMTGWKDSEGRYENPLVWSVVHSADDITALMRDAVGAPLYEAFSADADLAGAAFVDGRTVPATAKALREHLARLKPLIIVTTSHGQIGPPGNPDLMRRQLGAIVDAEFTPEGPEELLSVWKPDGAIWLAQACCSAGSQSPSMFRDLFEPTSAVGSVLESAASVGPVVSPLPRALLGAARPLRAFIGHVEPTFDWTMTFPPTRQQLTHWARETMYSGAYGGIPIGLALESAGLYEPVGPLLLRQATALKDYASETDELRAKRTLDLALYGKVTAFDRAATVLLGDPTVSIPLPNRS